MSQLLSSEENSKRIVDDVDFGSAFKLWSGAKTTVIIRKLLKGIVFQSEFIEMLIVFQSEFIEMLIPTAEASGHLGPPTYLPFSGTTVASTGTRSHSKAYATTVRVWPGTSQMQSCVRLSPSMSIIMRDSSMSGASE